MSTARIENLDTAIAHISQALESVNAPDGIPGSAAAESHFTHQHPPCLDAGPAPAVPAR